MIELDSVANGGHNPVAEVDIDVTKRATGDLGSWLGSAFLGCAPQAFFRFVLVVLDGCGPAPSSTALREGWGAW